MTTQTMNGIDSAVYFMTNALAGKNEVVMLRRSATGELTPGGVFATGGSGAGQGADAPYADPLGSQGALAVNKEHGLLFAVNARSNDFAVFRMASDGLTLLDTVNSGGNFPNSVATYGNWVYVLNAGGDGQIMGFTIQADGRLQPQPSSRRALGVGGVEFPNVFQAPGHILFSPDGTKLVVVEKGIRPPDQSTHKLHVFTLDAAGFPSAHPMTTLSHGCFPFAAAFTRAGQLLVVEVFGRGPLEQNTGAVSTYQVGMDGRLQVINGTVENYQEASCWIVTTGPYAYVTNFAGGTISGYRVAADGSLRLLNEGGATAVTGMNSYPIDFAATSDGRFLHVLLPGVSQVATYGVNDDGSLTALGALKGDWPISVQGLVVA